jgi:hypothetical protein
MLELTLGRTKVQYINIDIGYVFLPGQLLSEAKDAHPALISG